MSIMADYQKEEDERRERNHSKLGDYTSDDCPECKRQRVMRGDDGKRRCEKCGWCIEDNQYDGEFAAFLQNS